MKYIFLLILIIIPYLLTDVYSQDKVFAYTTQTRTLFSVPKDTDMKKITDLDLSRMKTKTKIESCENFVSGKDFSIETIVKNIDEPEYLSDRIYGIGSSISNINGIELFNYNGESVSFTKHQNPNDAEVYILPEEVYSYYGFSNNLFEFDLELFINKLYSDNYTVDYFPKDSILKAYNSFMELTIDFSRLYYETLYYEKNELKFMECTLFIKDKGYITPYKEFLSYFNYLDSGLRILKTEEKKYLNYSVIENDSVIYERFEEIIKPKSESISLYEYSESGTKNNYLKVYPNPAQDNISLEIPFDDEYIDIEICNMAGHIVQIYNKVNTSQINLNVSGLDSGSYIIYCKSNESIQSVKFIKN